MTALQIGDVGYGASKPPEGSAPSLALGVRASLGSSLAEGQA